jgi:hypothetical protein
MGKQGKQTEGLTYIWVTRQMGKQTDGQTDKRFDRPIKKQTERLRLMTYKQMAERYIDKLYSYTDRWTDRQTDTHTHIYSHTHTHRWAGKQKTQVYFERNLVGSVHILIHSLVLRLRVRLRFKIRPGAINLTKHIRQK